MADRAHPTRAPISSDAVWRASDVGDAGAWSVVLDEPTRDAVAEHTHALLARGVTPASIGLADVADSPLRDDAGRWMDELRDGRGFVLLRGFPVDRLSEPEVELAYTALGLLLGDPVSQDAHGTLLGHVRDRGVPRTSPAIRRYATAERQDFHTDGADVIGLLCLQRARAGGESRIVSAASVYNEILRRDPAAIDTLFAPMPWDRNDEQSEGEPPYYELPVLHDRAGRPTFFYIGWYIRDSQRHPEAPRLTAEQLHAMTLVEEIANDPTFHVEMDFRPGDVQLLNNAVILHSREAYEDHPEPERRRHLLRLWLATRQAALVDDLRRGGIPVRR